MPRQQDATSNPACFVSGTRIATRRGDVPVEHLRTDDFAITHTGHAVPVIWIGRRHLDCRRHKQPGRVSPIRIRRGAFAPGQPDRDLRLSPDHAVFIDGALSPVRHLVNGATIVQEPASAVTYWHVELAHHDILRAEGLPVESYLDTGNRGGFENGRNRLILHPDFGTHAWETQACAPLLRSGEQLAAIRCRLHARALGSGHVLVPDPHLHVLADGRRLRTHACGRHWCVPLPAGTDMVRLVSRTWVPAHSRPMESDHRRLGIAVARLRLDGRAVDPGGPALGDGWHAAEPWGCWTGGDGCIRVGDARRLDFVLAMTGDYWQDFSCSDEKMRAA